MMYVVRLSKYMHMMQQTVQCGMELITTPFSTLTASRLWLWGVGRTICSVAWSIFPVSWTIFPIAWTIRSDKKEKDDVFQLQKLVILLRGCRFVVQLVMKFCRVYADMNKSSGILPLLQATFIINRNNSGPAFSLPEQFFQLPERIVQQLPEWFFHKIFVKHLNLNVECPLERRNVVNLKDTIVADVIPGLLNNLMDAVLSFTEISIVL